ncbi:Rtc5p NDAI_0C01610 [Naumovozyma dairenensis CBS 421]|uniref:Restriction of telomere capping protein 5 n=1 Tax=Naumovozyma dairenensis (strain ATCC 10597 / BCRC 20456 / CBS 421 / NBRC 0211 / NRRL Y-12639) TaxID=1071378 RepID=G0W7R1_NAUDC|nr:hypothetical protein NDAI_0C01610 [Naumovozyma dairenensis CBS 421]CCD23822.1 hypothetical protein NDAI_0C01610 [Naumovozyma dairenensis CBS 421]
MGQHISSAEKPNTKTHNEKEIQFGNALEVQKYFQKRTIGHFTPLELISYKNKLNHDHLDDMITKEEIIQLLHLPDDNVILSNMIFNMVHSLCNFPFLGERIWDITAGNLLTCIILLDNDRCQRFIGSKSYDQIKLLFILLCLSTNNSSGKPLSASNSKLREKSENISTTSIYSQEIGYNLTDILQSYNGISIDDLSVPALSLSECFTWTLIMSIKCPTANCKILPNETIYNSWNEYQKASLNILRSMDSSIVSNLDDYRISFTQFENVFTSVVPNFTHPLENIMNHLLYMDKDLINHPVMEIPKSKLMSESLLAQLSTTLPKELFISKLQKLYIGRQSGFSMRSLQSKCFKWLAPTILLVSGLIIPNDEEYNNPRFKRFLQEFPKLNDNEQSLEPCHSYKKKISFAVYIDEPWRVTNKEFFGDLNSRIIELSPRQDIFKSLKSHELIYFNTIGCGIGIGDKQPHVSNGANSRKYQPGNVSLTLESTLEFAVFRHVGHGGAFSPSELLTKRGTEEESFEIKFIIQDVEVWGCGGEKELEEQMKQLAWEEAEAKRRQQVNLKSISEDRALLEMVGLVGQHQSGGSM